jgi:hypothetical protein
MIMKPTPPAESVATSQYPLGYVLNLKLADPAQAETFADRFNPGGYTDNTGGLYVIPWQMISHQDGLLVAGEQKILIVGSLLLALLALGSLTVLVGGRRAARDSRRLRPVHGGEPGRQRQPAAGLVAGRGRARRRDGGGRTHVHTSAPRRPPPRRRDAASRRGVGLGLRARQVGT